MSARGPFRSWSGIGAALLVDNVDTDQIIRSRDITYARAGLGEKLFAAWRYVDDGPHEDPAFVLNRARHRDTSVLVVGANFGCGSSREAAVWALDGFGVRAIVAKSFGTIFRANCVANGLVPVVLAADEVDALAAELDHGELPPRVVVDLEATRVAAPSGRAFAFSMDPLDRALLLEGLDTIDIVRSREREQELFDRADRIKRPWIYVEPS